MTLHNKINDTNINNLQKESIVPKWIKTKEDALIYIELDFSTSDKMWKESYKKMIDKYKLFRINYF